MRHELHAPLIAHIQFAIEAGEIYREILLERHVACSFGVPSYATRIHSNGYIRMNTHSGYELSLAADRRRSLDRGPGIGAITFFRTIFPAKIAQSEKGHFEPIKFTIFGMRMVNCKTRTIQAC